MPYWQFIWDVDDDPLGNVAHVEEHGITKDEAEEVLGYPLSKTASSLSGRPIAFGITSSGKTIAVVYEPIDEDTAYPITAYEVEL
jgi:uncharacterized DUF497 family protein